MYTFEKTERLEIPLTIAYQVASGIENYHEFIYGMKPVNVLIKGNDYVTVTFKSHLLGDSVQMTAQFKKNRSIYFRQDHGPFRELSGHWIFDGNEKGVLVTFSTAMSHKNFIIDKTLRVLGSELCERVMKDFKKQADQVIQQTTVNLQEKQITKDI